MTGRRARSRGFSFIEVLVACTLSAVLLAIGLPRLTRVRAPYVISGATRQIAAHLQAARQRAIARNTSYRLNFNTTNNTYTIERLNGAAWVIDGARQRLPTGAQLGTLAPGNPVFNPQGMVPADVIIPVTVTGATSRSVRINVLGKTSIT